MKILFFFQLFNVLLKSTQAIESVVKAKIYNFPMEVGQTNIIYLEEYTPELFQAPLYQISQNEYNVTILQSVFQIYYQTLVPNKIILFGCNYITQSDLFSNTFWIYTNNQTLQQGTIQDNGEISLVQQSAYFQNCFQLSLITNNLGMLSCNNNGVLQFNMINSSNTENTNYITNYTFPTQYTNPNVYIKYQNSSSFTIYIVYTTSQNAVIAFFIYNGSNIFYQNQLTFNGYYTQAILSKKINYLFLMNSQFVYLVNLQTKVQEIQELFDHSTVNSQDLQPFTQMAIFQITNDTFHFVILQDLILTSFQFNINFFNKLINVQSYILSEYSKILKIQVTIENIYIITNSFILKLISRGAIMAKNYVQLQEGYFALIQLQRQIVIVQEYIQGQYIVSTYLLNLPQILISEDQSQQLQMYNQPYLLDILVTSQSIAQQAYYLFKLQIFPVNITQNTCPILYDQQIENLYFKYPEQLTIPKNKIFLGPNLTVSLSSNNSLYLYAGQSQIFNAYWSVQNAIYLVVCAWIESVEIYCTQYHNYTILISEWNPYFNGPSYKISSKQNITSCKCYKSIEGIEVLIQFNQTISVYQLDRNLKPQGDMIQFQYPLPIISCVILQSTLFVLTNDSSLNASNLNNQIQLFTISNYQFNQIYINPVDYPNFLFLDNVYELLILSYNGQQSYEIINSIQYPLISYDLISFGILRGGIFMAFSYLSNSFLYFYPTVNIFIQNSIQNYFQITIQGYQFYLNHQIFSTYTSNNFYIIFIQSQTTYLARYQARGTQFTSLISFSYFYPLKSPNKYLQISSISWYQIEQEINIVSLFTSSSGSLNHTFVDFDFQYTTHYAYNESFVIVGLNYSASNQNCTYKFNQNAIIEYERNIVIAREFNDAQVLSIQDKTEINIDPNELFLGNVQNYTVKCDTCYQFEYIQPISVENSYIINYTLQAVLEYQDAVYLQNNMSLFQLLPQEKQLVKLYDFSVQNSYCTSLFVDILSQFPVSTCQSTIYAYNTTSQEVIMFNLSDFNSIYDSEYNNGILQIFTKVKVTLSYFAFYFWIENNTINLQLIVNQSNVCQQSYVHFIYLSMSSNFTVQPCQTYGFIATYTSGQQNSQIFLLQTCIPENISLIFGFQPNQTITPGLIYFKVQSWNLKPTQAIEWPFMPGGSMQLGSPKQISKDLVEVKFIVPEPNNINLYPALFNLTNGELIAFLETQIFYVACNTNNQSYLIYQGAPGLIMTVNFFMNDYFVPSVYSYENAKLFLNKTINKNIIGITGYEMIQINPNSQYTSLISGNYYVLSNSTFSQIFYVQNYLTLKIDLTGIEQSTIEIQTNNPISSSTQKLFILNENYQTYKSQQEHKFTILIIILSILVFLILLVLWYCIRTKRVQNIKSNSFELMET